MGLFCKKHFPRPSPPKVEQAFVRQVSEANKSHSGSLSLEFARLALRAAGDLAQRDIGRQKAIKFPERIE
jgi:hypothetical protein